MGGWKTYAVAALAVGHALAGWYLGLHGAETAIELTLAALGLGSLRHGLTREVRRIASGNTSE